MNSGPCWVLLAIKLLGLCHLLSMPDLVADEATAVGNDLSRNQLFRFRRLGHLVSDGKCSDRILFRDFV